MHTERVIENDKRTFPRLQGGISVKYRVFSENDDKALASWIKGNEISEGEGEWRTPDPFMDFSGTGLKFDDQLHCKVGDLLLIELQVPPSEYQWRVTARVVRVEPIQREEDEEQKEAQEEIAPTHQIAVSLEHLPKDLTEALTAFALKIQDALLQI